MTSIQQLMRDDHNFCDELYIEAENHIVNENWSEAESAFKSFVSATLRHFEHEENTLFPAFENATGMRAGPTEVMRHEHQQIKYLMTDLEEAISNHDKERCISLSETLLIFMRQHNMKEEQVLYPMIEQNCGNDADQLMKDFINKNNSSAA